MSTIELFLGSEFPTGNLLTFSNRKLGSISRKFRSDFVLDQLLLKETGQKDTGQKKKLSKVLQFLLRIKWTTERERDQIGQRVRGDFLRGQGLRFLERSTWSSVLQSREENPVEIRVRGTNRVENILNYPYQEGIVSADTSAVLAPSLFLHLHSICRSATTPPENYSSHSGLFPGIPKSGRTTSSQIVISKFPDKANHDTDL